MSDWYEKAHEELEKDYDAGFLTDKEYRQAVRNLNREYEEYVQEYTQEHYTYH